MKESLTMSNAQDISTSRLHLKKTGTLHWFHWLIVGLSLLLTFFAWYFSQKQIDERVNAQFHREAQQVIELVLERMQHYEDALWAGVAMLQAEGGDTDYKTWRTYVHNLHLLEKYPGINGLGVIHQVKPNQLQAYLKAQRKQRPNYYIHPQHKENIYLPISYIIPITGNEKAVGLDMAHEANRFSAAIKAKKTGLAQITGPITLVQDKARTPGFLFYAPIYQGGTYTSEKSREQHFTGLVYAPFIFKKLISGVLAQQNRHVALKISDQNNVLYNELVKGNTSFYPKTAYKITENVVVYGRVWTFTIWGDLAFEKATHSNQPLTILLGGIVIDALLLLLFIMISRGRKRALSYADEVTQDLKQKTQKLEASNKELNKFAYVTSHDLRAPLRGIENLVAWIKEDDAESLSEKSQERLNKLQSRLERMDNLINGILAYSRAGNTQNNITSVNVNDLVTELVDSLSGHRNVVDLQLDIVTPLPTLDTNATVISQVFSNLISNAIKYSDKSSVMIKISCQENANDYQFSVSDNGPGIEPQFHEKIFDLFQTLQSKDDSESSGVGLALVKKIVEMMGGEITLHSTPGQGCTFMFTWPKESREV